MHQPDWLWGYPTCPDKAVWMVQQCPAPSLRTLFQGVPWMNMGKDLAPLAGDWDGGWYMS